LATSSEDVRPIRAARREAGLASNKADEARRRAAIEIWWRRGELQAADKVLALVRRLAGSAVHLWLDGQPEAGREGEQAVGAWAAQATAAAAKALRENAPLPPELSPPPAPSRAQVVVEEIEALYHAARSLAGGKAGASV
jgi:hypothetical protein